METDLIPRKLLFGNPDKASVQVSPDGRWVAWLAPRDERLNVWVAERDHLDTARPVTHDTGRGIRFYAWAYTGEHILYLQDKGGDENWRVYLANINTGEVIDLTPLDGVRANVVTISHIHPGHIIVGLNDRDARFHDLYRIDLQTAERTLLLQNDRFAEFHVDDEFNLVAAAQSRPDGGMTLFRRAGEDWHEWEVIPQEDVLTTGIVGLDKTGRHVYLQDSRGRNTAALFIKELAGGEQRLVAEDPHVDLGEVFIHPTEKTLQAVSFTYDRKRWQPLDPVVQADFDYLASVTDGEISIGNRSLDDHWWVVVYNQADSPLRYYLYDRHNRTARFLFTNRSALENYPLAKMHPAVFPARDGQELVGYYTLPVEADPAGTGTPAHPLPMVLFPHGGPWGRDEWGFNTFHQWLANRGYAVLAVNFRASTGFGKAFVNAGDKNWGTTVIQDQVDAVNWAVSKGIADPQKVAIMGGSFGGYSVLAGLTFFPALYACGVDIVGPSNLITLLESIPPYWAPMLELFTTRVGDFRTEEGRALLKAHSPLTYADRICRPLLIAQGANDPRVKKAESDQIVAAMQAKNIPVTYLLYPDEGHGFARPENNLSFSAVAEAFLAKCLHGRVEPVGEDFQGSSIEVVAGRQQIDL